MNPITETLSKGSPYRDYLGYIYAVLPKEQIIIPVGDRTQNPSNQLVALALLILPAASNHLLSYDDTVAFLELVGKARTRWIQLRDESKHKERIWELVYSYAS